MTSKRTPIEQSTGPNHLSAVKFREEKMSKRKYYGYGGQIPMSGEELVEEYAKLGVAPKPLPPHERPGHRSPDQPSERDRSAIAGIEAVRHPDLNDGIDHT